MSKHTRHETTRAPADVAPPPLEKLLGRDAQRTPPVGSTWNGIRRLWLDADLHPLDPQPPSPLGAHVVLAPATRVDY